MHLHWIRLPYSRQDQSQCRWKLKSRIRPVLRVSQDPRIFFAKSVRSTLRTFASTALLREGKGRGRATLEQSFGMWGSFLSAGGQPRDRPKFANTQLLCAPMGPVGHQFPLWPCSWGSGNIQTIGIYPLPICGRVCSPTQHQHQKHTSTLASSLQSLPSAFESCC